MTFFSGQTRSNICIFWNFILKEIKNDKNIIVWPFYWYFKQRPILALLIFAHPSAQKKAIFAHF